jgi:uncharacterized membrane protein YphA (DoxX/SURF4 family)
MNPDPFSDALKFLLQPAWTTGFFWLLLLASIGIAVYVYGTIPGQRRVEHIGDWATRVLVGGMWWQQSLWKLPPYYTDQPDTPFGATGLAYWMGLMGKHASISLQADFVNHIVLPNFYLFAPIVYGLEVLTAISLILGFFVRLFGIIGALQVLNLWLGLYSAPHEWPWTYFFLLLLMVTFALHRYGRSLGIDAIIAPLLEARRSLAGRVLAEAA